LVVYSYILNMKITASKLYDYLQCPHRPWRDVHGPQEEKSQEINAFIQLLWERGVAHEEKVIGRIGEFVNIKEFPYAERQAETLKALKSGAELIYQGVLETDDLFGIPDLIQKMPDGSYMPIDIKSGMALEGVDEETDAEGKPKKHYAVQLCLYNELLRPAGFADHYQGKIIDASCSGVVYNLTDSMGVRNKTTWLEFYEKTKNEVGLLLENKVSNDPATAGVCKLCPWYDSCKKWCIDNNDLSNIFYLGRSIREVLQQDLHITKVPDLLDLDVVDLLEQKKKDKTFLPGLGEKTLNRNIKRAKVMVEGKPVAYEPIEFPEVTYELFFDIEDDPTQEFVYLHGVYERTPKGERFLDFTARETTPEAEQEAWSRFWDYIKSLPKDDFSVYYYSHHEKTTYKKMQKKYPDVISEKEVCDFFDNPNVIDLYKVVTQKTDWPLSSYSIKALAVYLGFEWRDKTPSGALSIQWFNDYLETKNEEIMKRILEYNEDDCKATMVLKDGITKL
jgi:predicted RecB family nuclease